MTNEQIDRGIKKSNDILKGTHNIRVKRRMADINEVLEAMKEPEEEEDDIYISEHGTVYRKDIDYVEGYKKWEAKREATKEQS